jgi:carboxyl-terminal processing protease
MRELPASANFPGIGAALAPRLSPDGYVVITHILPQADEDVKAALRPGDKIARIEGESVRNRSLAYVVARIRGEENTPLRLTVLRAGTKKPVTVTVKRRVIRAE